MIQSHNNIVDLSGISLEKALVAWRLLLGENNVLTGEAALHYNNCPSQMVRHIPAVLYPGSHAQVQDAVLIAAHHKIPLSPVSTGRNWGFGGASPAKNSAVIVDLSRMNRIIDFMPDLGVVTVEPGVTQRQLADFLEQGNYPFMISASASSPNCSVIGNALERGHGMMPYMDRFQSLTSLKAVLPDGSLYQSLLADGGGEVIDKTYKWGVGPYIDGLFSQGGFGIVTQASFILSPKPEQVTMFMFSPRAKVSLDTLIDRLRIVKHNSGHLISTFEIGTRPAAQDADAKIPVESPLDKISEWSVLGAIHATRAMTAFIRKMMVRELRDVAGDFVFFDENTLSTAGRVSLFRRDTPMRRYVRRNQPLLKEMLSFYRGQPQDNAISYAYHHLAPELRAQEGLSVMEKNMRKTGLIFYWPLLPARGSDVRLFIDMMKRVSEKHGMTPVFDMNLEHSTSIRAGMHIFYDPTTQKDAAQAYYEDLFREGKALGYLPHRAHMESAGLYTDSHDSHYFSMLKKIKAGIDPDGIISMRLQPL